MRYVRDVPADDQEAIDAERAHVIAHLSAVASEDDDPETNADDVQIWVTTHPDDPTLVRIVGELDAEPNAPYLQGGYDPYANVSPGLLAAAGLTQVVNATGTPEPILTATQWEVLRGQA